MKKMLLCLLPLLMTAARAETETASPFAVPSGLMLIVVLVALIVAICVVGSMRAKLKTAKKQAAAANYVRKDSLDMRYSQDWFLYRTESRRKIETKK